MKPVKVSWEYFAASVPMLLEVEPSHESYLFVKKQLGRMGRIADLAGEMLTVLESLEDSPEDHLTASDWKLIRDVLAKVRENS